MLWWDTSSPSLTLDNGSVIPLQQRLHKTVHTLLQIRILEKKFFFQLEIATIGLLAGVHSINAQIKNYDIWIALRLFLLFLSHTIQALFYKIYGEIL